ncbi:YeiH family protein [Microlunatus sp. Gsoil 973]|uniref:YeiH family protein n=1 Tax=Microlunatus sp. Gsoil 973 TaxID=2672569 RepID=UPI0012B4F97E|nr:putative sulfate exporter family transporter [Microlunatus sp. Gsoil 973]QGN34095.1 putative sulfate exporter family transporter [Microlunatus sp. Gsoil 973]
MTAIAPPLPRRTLDVLPGVVLCGVIAAVAVLIGTMVPVLGSAVPAILLGVLIRLVRRPDHTLVPGVRFAGKTLLQVAVVLLGSQLSIGEVAGVGLSSLPVMLGTLAGCLLGAWLVGRALGVVGDLRTLIGVGTGVCGASAIAAVSPVIVAADATIAYAISTVFVFNIAAVLTFPLVGHLLGLSQQAFGLFAGTAVNDTSSVIAAASAYGPEAMRHAVVVKLVRSLMIIPICLALGAWVNRRTPPASDAGSRKRRVRIVRLVPGFLVGFLVMAVARSVGVVPTPIAYRLAPVAAYLIAVAMAGIGLSTDLPALRRTGPRPLLLGGALWLIVGGTSLGIQHLVG